MAQSTTIAGVVGAAVGLLVAVLRPLTPGNVHWETIAAMLFLCLACGYLACRPRRVAPPAAAHGLASLSIAALWLAFVLAVFGASKDVRSIDPFDSARLLGTFCIASLAAGNLLLLGIRTLRRPVFGNLCEVCFYDLRGTIEPRCPECGTPFSVDSQARGAERQDG